MTRYHTLTNTRYVLIKPWCLRIRPVHFQHTVEAPCLMQATHDCIPHPLLNEQHAAEPPFNHVLEVKMQCCERMSGLSGLATGQMMAYWSARAGRGKKKARAVTVEWISAASLSECPSDTVMSPSRRGCARARLEVSPVAFGVL